MTAYDSRFDIELVDHFATENLGTSLAKIADSRDVFLLNGDLGSGKSVLARAFIRAYCQTNEDIPSPTFNLVQTYHSGAFTVYHFDLYRLNSLAEILEEAFSDGISLIEWPDRLGDQLPENRLVIHIMAGNELTSRKVLLTGYGCWKIRLIHSFENGTINL